MLFKRLLVLEDETAASAALNMAIDEALLEQCQRPLLRFYGWRSPAISFGYFGKIAEAEAEAKGREFVRRWTGGGIVPHGRDLTYSLVTPVSDPAAAEGPVTTYRLLHSAIRDALLAEGRETRLAEEAAPKISDACFANPVRHDLLRGEQKIAGAAQRRTRRGFLHQGSIQLPDLPATFRRRFALRLTDDLELVSLSAAVLKRAEILAAEKYGSEAWIRRW